MQVPEGLEKTVINASTGEKRTTEVLSPPSSLSVKKSKMADDDMPNWTKNFSKLLMDQFKEEVFNPFKTEILDRLDKVEGQVVKIPELEKSTTFVGDELQRVEKLVSDNSKDNSYLETRVNQLYLMVENERKDKQEIKNKLNELEDRQRRDNLVFEGVPDKKGETPRDCMKNIRKHLKETLSIPNADDIVIGRAHRLGPYKEGENRQTILKFDRYQEREKVWSKGKELPHTSANKIKENFSKDTEKARSKLYPLMKIARSKGYFAKLEGHKLIVRDKENVNITCTLDDLSQLPADLDPAKLFTPQDNNVTLYYTLFSPHSAFYKCEFHEGGLTFNCLEQYVIHKNALTIKDEKLADSVLGVHDPVVMKSMAKGKFGKIDLDIKQDHVKNGMRLKYSQNEDLKQYLKDTGTTTLAESSPFDLTWGTGRRMTHDQAFDKNNWPGQNLHGKLLMEVRNEFAEDWD